MISARLPYRKSDLGLFLWPPWSVSGTCQLSNPVPREDAQTEEACLPMAPEEISLTDLFLCSLPSLTSRFSCYSLAPMPLKYLQNVLPCPSIGAEVKPASSAHVGFTHKSFSPLPSVLHQLLGPGLWSLLKAHCLLLVSREGPVPSTGL